MEVEIVWGWVLKHFLRHPKKFGLYSVVDKLGSDKIRFVF